LKALTIGSCKEEHRKQQVKIHMNLIAPSNSETRLCFNPTLKSGLIFNTCRL